MIVYLITNTINGKRYVGQTKRTLAARWWQHCKTKGCYYLHRAIQKYGKEHFSIETLCEPPTQELTNEMEEYCIARYNSVSPNGYNLTSGGKYPKFCKEMRQRMSASRQGIRPPSSFSENWTSEMRIKCSRRYAGAGNPNSKLSIEDVKLIRELYATGKYSQASLAQYFPVCQAQISKIVLNKQFVNV